MTSIYTPDHLLLFVFFFQHFQEAVSQETGLTMVPLHHDSKEEVKQQERIECDGNSRVGTLRAPANSTTGNHVISKCSVARSYQ